MKYFIIKRSNFNKIFYFEKEWYPIEVIEVELDTTFFSPVPSYVRLLDDEGNVYTRYPFELFDSREEAEKFTGIYQAVGTDGYPIFKKESSIISSEIHIPEIQMNELVGVPDSYCQFEEDRTCSKLMGIHRLVFINKGKLKEFLIWSFNDNPGNRIKDKYSTWLIKGMGDLEVIETFLKNFINLKCFPVLFFDDNYEIGGMDKFAKMKFKDLPVIAIESQEFIHDKIKTMRFSNYHWIIKAFSKEVNLFYCVNTEYGGYHQFHGRDLFLDEDAAAEAISDRVGVTYNIQ